MLIDFVGSLATGFGLMGIVLLVNRLILRNRIDRWIYPATVAFGMVAFTIWAEYTWPSRTITAQPQLALASENGEAVFYRPWTFIWPQVTRMTAINLAETRTHPDQPGMVMTQVVFIGRWEPTRGVVVIYDCVNNARADVVEGVAMNADGTLEGAEWFPLDADNPVLRTACAAVEEGNDGRASGA
ncbi:hypothetical protein [Pararhodobacter zhoushanensis]|uniref:Uncharacterized protein n=1 Tax=Pararhodobacter zhoushanensis TaxID=2479545 RepID=A0ABT3GY48_9RHOB|nr:hypothetical protein [Pararhodobacter zhoushanensis]MCW1932457.1 hypothetical protein [Pararhodobacter zhoushanensis]